jgi:hypothetical protein
MLTREAEVRMKRAFMLVIALLAACAGAPPGAPAVVRAAQPSEHGEGPNCGVLVYTPAGGSAARGLERVCSERPVKIVR